MSLGDACADSDVTVDATGAAQLPGGTPVTRPTHPVSCWGGTIEVPEDVPPLALRGVLARGGSGYEQAESELCRVQGRELTVALGPPA